jgi:hypothetical protein
MKIIWRTILLALLAPAWADPAVAAKIQIKFGSSGKFVGKNITDS